MAGRHCHDWPLPAGLLHRRGGRVAPRVPLPLAMSGEGFLCKPREVVTVTSCWLLSLLSLLLPKGHLLCHILPQSPQVNWITNHESQSTTPKPPNVAVALTVVHWCYLTTHVPHCTKRSVTDHKLKQGDVKGTVCVVKLWNVWESR